MADANRKIVPQSKGKDRGFGPMDIVEPEDIDYSAHKPASDKAAPAPHPDKKEPQDGK